MNSGPEKFGITPQEVFEPKEELKKIRELPKEKKAESLERFKRNLNNQMEGLAGIEEEVIRAVRNNPDASAEDIYKAVEKLGAKYGINEEQKDIAKEVALKYEYKHQKIKEVREKYPEDKELFKALFGRYPEGNIEIIVGPITFYIRCQNKKDYSLIYTENFFGDEEKADSKEKMEIKRSAGISIKSSLIPDLEGTVTAEKSGWWGFNHKDFVDSASIYKHEEQHAIRNLFDKQVTVFFFPKRLKATKTDEEKELVVKNFLRFKREKFDEAAADEMLAYSTDHTTPKEIYAVLTRKGGNYDYFDEEEKNKLEAMLNSAKEDGLLGKLGEKSDEDFEKWIQNLVKEIYVTEYSRLIMDGVESLEKLQKMGYSRQKTISLLTHEPLSRWKKIVGRLH